MSPIGRLPDDPPAPGDEMALFTPTVLASSTATGSPVTQVTIPGITAGPDECLILLLGYRMTATFIHASGNQTWGGTAITGAAQSVACGSGTNRGSSRSYYWTPDVATTGDIVINFTALNKPTDVAYVVLKVRKTGSGALFQNSILIPPATTPGVPTTSLAGADASTSIPPYFAIISQTLLTDVAHATGTWATGLTRLARVGTTLVTVDVAYGEGANEINFPFAKSGFTSCEWGIAGGLFTGIIGMGGVTSYGAGRFEVSSPEGGVTPEVAAQIRRGDQRYMRN